jgi:hypothetical protein
MKKLLSFLTLIAFTVALYGQRTGGYKKNSVGLDLVPIMQNAVHSDSLIPYGVTYRRFIAPNHAVRARFDVGYKSKFKEEPGTFPHTTHTIRQSVGIGAGYEYVLPLLSWVDFSCGLSLSYRKSETGIRTKFSEYISGTTNDDIVYALIEEYQEQPLSKQYFVQPFVGLTLHVGNRVSILSEFSPYYSYTCLQNTYDRTERRSDFDFRVNRHTTWGGPNYTLREVNAQCSVSLLLNF